MSRPQTIDPAAMSRACNPATGDSCKGLVLMLGPQLAKGLSWFETMSLDGTRREYGPICKATGSRSDAGLMLNFCPFCGVDLRPMHKGRVIPREAAS